MQSGNSHNVSQIASHAQCQLILNRIIYNISVGPGPWLLVIGSCRVLAMTLLARSLPPGPWLLHGPWLLVHGMLVQVANGCRIETWAVMAHGCRAVYIATSPREGAGRRGASWDSSVPMILYINNSCKGCQFFIAWDSVIPGIIKI